MNDESLEIFDQTEQSSPQVNIIEIILMKYD